MNPRQQRILEAIGRRLQELENIRLKLAGMFNRDKIQAVGYATFAEIEMANDSNLVRCDYTNLFGQRPTPSQSVQFSRDLKQLENEGRIERVKSGRRTIFLKLRD